MRVNAMRHAVSALLLMALTCGMHGAEIAPATASAAVIPADVQALADAHAGVTSMIGSFRWLTGAADGSGEPRERRGQFAVQRGAAGAKAQYNLRSESLTGDDLQRWCSDGTESWLIEQPVTEEPPTIKRMQQGAHDVDIERVVACVLLDLPRLAPDFAMRLESRAELRHLEFTPRTTELREHLQRIVVILTAAGDPQEVLLDDAKGTRIRLLMQQVARNQPLDPWLFRPVPK
jgi:hypothetical protein